MKSLGDTSSGNVNQNNRSPVPLATAKSASVPFYSVEEIAKQFNFVNYYATFGKHVHEADFHFFEGMLEGRVFCDIGANIGQSILSLSCVDAKGEIHAFEINPLLTNTLKTNVTRFGVDVVFHEFGIGERDSEVDLHLPVLGKTVAHTLGSVNLEAMKNANIASHLSSLDKDVEPHVIRVRTKIRNFDSLGLRPDYIKIDAEGAEIEVLKGMPRTLTEHRPLLMIENSFEGKIRSHMLSFGYLPFVYVRPLHALILKDAAIGDTLIGPNTFYLHYARIQEFQSLGRIASIQKIMHQLAIEPIQAAESALEPLDQRPTLADVAYAYRLILGHKSHFAHFNYHWNEHTTIRAMRDTFIAAISTK